MKLRTYLICRIIFTFLFLIISTTVWFNRKVAVYHEVESKIESNDVIVSNLRRLSENDDKIYNLKINNNENDKQDIKVYIVPNALSESAPNNYIKYQVNDGNIKTLNMDGMIIVDTIDSHESMDINLKLWLSDTYEGNLNYDGRVIVL
ncbi:MAG: hypothetical protein IKN63_01210 [Bacilli bacterium]|nr:hypothetical protein [Bacilli bacterium]